VSPDVLEALEVGFVFGTGTRHDMLVDILVIQFDPIYLQGIV
jgi:hypothetical protein